MKLFEKTTLSALVCLLLFTTSYAQQAADALENGIVVAIGEKIYFGWNGKTFLKDVSKDGANLIPAQDSPLYLTRQNANQVWIRPMNPLNYSIGATQNYIVETIDADAAAALGGIIDALKLITTANKDLIINRGRTKALDGFYTLEMKTEETTGTDPCSKALNKVTAEAQNLESLLKQSKQVQIAQLYLKLEALDFRTPNSVKTVLDQTRADVSDLKKNYFEKIDAALNNYNQAVSEFNCTTGREILDRFTMKLMADKYKSVADNEKKRLSNLENALKLVSDEYDNATYTASTGDWFKQIEFAQLKPGQITEYVVSVYDDGMNVVNNEIVKADQKQISSYYYRIQRFRRIIPEVAAGIAYADLTFPNYTLQPDEAGNQHVVSAGEEVFKKINITTMLNFNYYLPKSPVHPFFQIGIGANADYPTLFTGIGLRSNVKPISRLAISFGFASTWIKTLNTLKVGDIVDGDADLQNDITYEFQWPLRPYMGIQYNF